MKKVLLFTLVLPFLIISCEKDPVAQFHTDTTEPEVGHEVRFRNDSHNASQFEWDFGDGFVSNDRNPVHVYTGTGSYDVSLTAISKKGLDDKATLTLNVLIPTLLEIEVREYYQEYTVPDASVILYPTLPDWNEQTNESSEGWTDSNGIVVFSNLDPFVYYVDVWEATHDNYDLAGEDVGFIRTPEILPHQINRFVAWVDIVDHTKGAVSGTRHMVIKKLERKAADKKQPASIDGTSDWKILYERSIRKK